MKRKEKNKIFNLEQKTLNIIGIALSTLVIIAITIYYGIQLNREDIDRKTLNIIGISLSLIIILIVTIYYSFQMNREYTNGDKRLPFTIEKNTIITVLDGQRKTIENDNQNEMLEIGIIDDIYLDLKLNDEKNKKIKSITLDKFDITNEFEDTKKIKIVPISENLTEKKEDKTLENGKIEFKIEHKNDEENSKVRVGFRLYHEKISEKKVKKDEIITYGKGLVDNNNDVEKYNLAKIKFKVNITMDNNEEYETIINIDKVGMERKDFGLFKEENGKKVKIIKKYLQN